MPRETAAQAVSDIFEHAPWIGAQAVARGPSPTVAALHDAMMTTLRGAPAEQQIAFIRGHPELGSKVKRVDITTASQAEQGSLGLDRLSDAEFAHFQKINAAYRERFGIPFIICVRRHTRDSILRQFERRLRNTPEQEREAAIQEIGLITRLRLSAKIDGPGKPKTEGRLSTHVLDTTTGRPAAKVPIALYEVGASARGLLMETITNVDGRTDAPLMSETPLRIGAYQLEFDIAGHFNGKARMFDRIPIRFSIAEAEAHYHVPLLVTPWSYTTYRGS